MEKQFKITAYLNHRDFSMKRNGKTFTDIESLLRFVNASRYYNTNKNVEVSPTEEWHYLIREIAEGYLTRVIGWEIEELPTDTTIRIVGVDTCYALPQTTDKYVYEDILDADIENMNSKLYPYTMSEFITALSKNDKYLDILGWDYIAILNH